MPITLNTTAPVTTPTTSNVACDSGFVTSFKLDGSKLFTAPPRAEIEIRPYASNGGNPIVADAAATLKFKTANAIAAAQNVPEIAAFEAALYALGNALPIYAAARQYDLAAAQAALTAAQQAAANATSDLPGAVAAVNAAQANVAAAQAALDDFANPPLVTQ